MYQILENTMHYTPRLAIAEFGLGVSGRTIKTIRVFVRFLAQFHQYFEDQQDLSYEEFCANFLVLEGTEGSGRTSKRDSQSNSL